MKSKQVAALFLAAALAVTGSGVTTLAGQTGAQEAVVFDSEGGLKLAEPVQDSSDQIKIDDTIVGNAPYEYGAQVTIKAKLVKDQAVALNKNATHKLQIVSLDSDKDFTSNEGEIEIVPGAAVEGKLNDAGEFEGAITFKPDARKQYAVRGITVLQGQHVEDQIYTDQPLDQLKVKKTNKTNDQIKALAPAFGTIYITSANAETALDADKIAELPRVKEVLEKANKELDPQVGQWSVDTTKNGDFKKETTSLDLNFTSYIYQDEGGANKGKFSVTLTDIKVEVYPTSIAVISNPNTDQNTNEETLIVDDSHKAMLTLTAKATRGETQDATEATSDQVQWVYPEGTVLSFKADKTNGSLTVAANGVTDEKGVVVKAVSKEAVEKVEKEFTIKVVKGIHSDTVKAVFEKYRGQFKDTTYAGDGTLGQYYVDLLEKMNQEPSVKDFGSFSFSNTDKMTEAKEEGVTTKLKFTAKAVTTPIVDADSWENGSNAPDYLEDEKEITLKIKKQTIDIASITAKLAAVAGTYPVGTSLQEIETKAKLDLPDTVEKKWVTKNEDGIWDLTGIDNTTVIKKPGKLSDYAISIKAADNTKAQISETNQSDNATYVYPAGEAITLTDPTFEASVQLKDSPGDSIMKSKYKAGDTAVLEPATKSTLSDLSQKYDVTYEWYKKGSDEELLTGADEDGKNQISIESGKLKITDLTEGGAGEYYCKATAKIKTAKLEEEKDLAEHFPILTTESSPVKVEVTGIEFSEASEEVTNFVYGSDDAEEAVSVTAKTTSEVTSYGIEYRKVDEDGNELEARKAAVLVEENILETPGMEIQFRTGYEIKALLKDQNLSAGKYEFYVTVSTKDGDSNTYGPIEVTVTGKEILLPAMDAAKLSVKNAKGEDLSYGDSLKDAVVSYGWDVSKEDEKEFAAALAYEIQDTDKILTAGENTIEVVVKAADNYTLTAEKTLKATVNVKKAVLKAEFSESSFTMTAGDKSLNLNDKIKVSGLANGDKEADILTVKAVVLDTAGKEASDLSALAEGAYRVKIQAELTEAGGVNYEKVATGETALLTVKAKAEEQKPGTQDPGTNKPGTQDPGTNKPGTQDPGTSTPGTNTPGTNTPGTNTPDNNQGTNTPGTQEKVTAKKVDITLNGQSLSGTVKAKTKTTYKLKAAVTLSNGKKASNVTWSTSNKKIATVSKSGVVKVQNKTGKVKITAKYADGKAKTITLNVAKSNVKAAKLKITGKTSMKVKKSQTLKVTVSPATVTNGKVTWKTSNKKIATVSSKGVVKALKKGKVTITATAKDGSKKKASFKITVK